MKVSRQNRGTKTAVAKIAVTKPRKQLRGDYNEW